MCGISGIVPSEPQSQKTLDRWLQVMNNLQAHRGPDGEGIWTSQRGNVGLGHVRLSIIDLETGGQPMRSEAELVISYNGEIYNYVE
ncbi:MAG: asparagine synthetase B, partial [Deltaproteobacteria bacterium]